MVEDTVSGLHGVLHLGHYIKSCYGLSRVEEMRKGKWMLRGYLFCDGHRGNGI
jgi:hypothetical protein